MTEPKQARGEARLEEVQALALPPDSHSLIARHSPRPQPACEGAILTQNRHLEPHQLTPHGAETSPLLSTAQIVNPLVSK